VCTFSDAWIYQINTEIWFASLRNMPLGKFAGISFIKKEMEKHSEM
jgi:hypothetical protein